MAIPKIKEQDIIAALKYIDEKGVPSQNQSTKYQLVTEDGKKYPPKYVIAVAAHLANGVDIATDNFNAVEAKSFLQGQGFNIEIKQEKFELTISAESVVSTDERFTMDNLSLGDMFPQTNGIADIKMDASSHVQTVVLLQRETLQKSLDLGTFPDMWCLTPRVINSVISALRTISRFRQLLIWSVGTQKTKQLTEKDIV